jgi:hypothetical protein
VFIAKYRFIKESGNYAYIVSAYQYKIMRKFREFCQVCGEDLTPRSKLTKFYTENGTFLYKGTSLHFEITTGDYI